ncbi:unnamed protein product [Amoebophrya sp. A120]|nr:unnamed protein product [Amoebophrya sp. A120]|eukprot:GSA120T00024789001.1
MDTFVDHCRKGKEFRTAMEDNLTHAKRKFQRELDFTAYQYGHDPMYLGVNGQIDYGKIWGQTSATMQKLLWPASYWRRVYFRKRNEDDPDPEHYETASVTRQQSAPAGAAGSSSSSRAKKGDSGPPADDNPKPTSLQQGTVPYSEPSTEVFMKNPNLQPFRQVPRNAAPASRVVKTPPQNFNPADIRVAVRKEVAKPGFSTRKAPKFNPEKVSPGAFFVPLQAPDANEIKPGPRNPPKSKSDPEYIDPEDVLAAINADGSYAGHEAGRLQREKEEAEMEAKKKEAMAKLGKMAVPMPDWPLHPQTGEKLDGYPFVRKWLEDEIRSKDKPYYPKTRPNEPFTFFNTLGRRNGKYCIKGVPDGNFPYQKETHRSVTYEHEYIAGLARRNDYNLITNDGLPPLDQDY